jgi:hypothetical protein
MGSKYKIKFVLFIYTLLIVGCNNQQQKKFYCDTLMDGDVWRLPIIEPFELITVDTNTFWSLHWSEELNKTYLTDYYNADSITYRDGLIIILNNQGNVFNQGIIDVKQEKVIKFKTRDDFYKYAIEDSLLHKMYSVKDLFRQYKQNGYLPWSKDIPNYQYCTPPSPRLVSH